ncbi:putative membrane protein [Anaerocolumna jejuensis DSM 15929]|jgi:putative membrane protein|uniref:Putative membrane protein n=1 Tax=Anaerocolumna jejuensis DSM 15929 TaxID=1121322 RepID=A0A1M6PL70_9FIRM|nr:phage holin family protein [Anaerocolumna jejuensis]SHK08722.1 putative membrane protein [Anaerocolumna jejuensis DSM 15929]
MKKIFFHYVSYIAVIYLLSLAIPTVSVYNSFSLLFVGVVLLLVNLLLKPLLLLVTLPLNILTLGLFNFVVNAWTIMIADHFVSGIAMGGFLNSLLAAFLISLLKQLLDDKK